jgi:hypothetical protein
MNKYDQLIYNVARQEGFTDIVAKLIAAQSRVETSDSGVDYSTLNFTCNNNMFGMKYVGQPLATRGTPAPSNERQSGCDSSGSGCDKVGVGTCSNKDFYARYSSPEDSVKDAIERLFKKTVRGVAPEELNTATDSTSYATIQKKRGYYGFHDYGTAGAQAEIDKYAAGLRARLKRVSVSDYISDIYKNNKTTVNLAVVGAVLIGITGYMYFLYKKGIILKK